ncbi:MAG TPA: nucleotide sugar dehydrogenase [Candidatus Sulfotelmatobacter sp.]|nr:nucleotide sugar dehydrogenase [Candidatus Sulfotelmatobacter sp.]
MTATGTRLRERIQDRTVRVAVIGCGYVGLPLAVSFARAGARTTAIDLNADRVARIRRGESYIPDVAAEDVRRAVAEGRLTASADYAVIAEMDAAFICVPTPFTRMKAPDISYVEAAARGVAAHLRPGMLVVLQSTTYPGTTEEVVQPILEAGGLRAGRDFHLAFSPERIDPGNRQYGAHNTPKVVGGIDAESTAVTAALFGLLIDPRHIHPVSGPKAAEMCKLLENIFRSVNIALVNELALLCDRMKIDIWEVIAAAATKPFGFMPFYPGPGVGGHCIPVDPYYLSWKAREYDFYTKFIELAAEVNQGMPFYTVGKVVDGLNARGQALQGARVLVLGAAFKRDIDDARNSPAVEVLKILWTKGAQVAFHDPYVPELHLEEPSLHGDPVPPVFRSVPLTEETLGAMDCVVIAVHHSAFDIPWIVKHSRLVVDAQNATRGLDGTGGQVVRL